MVTLSMMFDSVSSSSCPFVGLKFSGGSAISMDETGCKRWLSLKLRYTICSLIIHELLLLFVSSTTLIFMNYAPNMKV